MKAINQITWQGIKWTKLSSTILKNSRYTILSIVDTSDRFFRKHFPTEVKELSWNMFYLILLV